MKVLHLTLKRKWFDMIASGEKKEEYREMKLYWIRRLRDKHFDIVRFKNGYGKNVPVMKVELKRIMVSYGKQEWGAEEGTVYFVLKLGKIISNPQ